MCRIITFDKSYRNTKAKSDTTGRSFRTFRFACSGRLQYFLVFQQTLDNQQSRQEKSTVGTGIMQST